MSNISNKVQQAKDWLRNWYKERLPVVGLEYLQEQVDKGLETPHQVVQAPYTGDQVDIPDSIYGKYIFPGERVPLKSGKKAKVPNGLVVINADSIDSDLIDPITVHEANHGVHFDKKSRFIFDFMQNSADYGSFYQPYFQQPWEQHSYIMELRRLNNLDPKKVDYNKEDIKAMENHDGLSKWIIQNLHQHMSEDDLIKAMNTWAYNSKSDAFQEKRQAYYAKNGRRLIKHSNSVINYLNLFTND